jgi:hypothetical protein
MSNQFDDNYLKHGAVFKQYVQRLICSFDAPDDVSISVWIQQFISAAFDEWKTGGPNFAKWLSNDNRQLFDSPTMIEHLILYNNRYYKKTHNVNWIYQVADFNPNTVINTYASIYARTDPSDVIVNTIETYLHD